MVMPTVSFIVTAYNYESYVEECLRSCLDQDTRLPWEVILIDDGSTDDTYRVAISLKSPRLRVFKQSNSGIEAASNFGIRQARGKYLVRVDADDKLAPTYLEQALAAMAGDVFDFVYSDYFLFDNHSDVTGRVQLPAFDAPEIRQRGDFLATGTMFQARVLYETGLYNENTRNSGLENYELILRLLDRGAKALHLPIPLFYYRRHGVNISDIKKDKIIRYGQALFRRMNYGVYGTNENHPYQLRL